MIKSVFSTIAFLKYNLICLCLIFLLFSCQEPYEPVIVTNGLDILVVEGYLDAGDNVTTIVLSKLRSYNEWFSKTEEEAIVMVEGEDGSFQPLFSAGGAGRYVGKLELEPGKKYRLNIHTKNNKVYQSDYIPVVVTPEIDDISWEIKNEGVQIYANTHDPENKVKYYRWVYEETWEFTTPYSSSIMFNPEYMAMVLRTSEFQFPSSCWKSNFSRKVIIGTSARLKEDVIRRAPLVFLSKEEDKLSTKYSILVKQTALTKEAFEFWENLQKSSENMGSIFDPQPSQLPSNIYCISDPEEPVIGYLSASTVSTKRIFIRASEVSNLNFFNGYAGCKIDTTTDIMFFMQNYSMYAPLSESLTGMGTIYYYTDVQCVDCRYRGTDERPPFWDDDLVGNY